MKKIQILLLLSVFSMSLCAQTWTNYTVSNTSAPLGNRVVNAVLIDNNGVKWFGTSDGLISFDGETWKTYTTADHLISNNITSLTFYAELGTLWVGTDKGLSEFREGVWTSWLSGIQINAEALDNYGRLWIATNEGIYSYDGDVWNHYNAEINGIPSDRITCIAADGNPNFNDQFDIWFGTFDSGIGRFNGFTFSSYNLTDYNIDTKNMALSIAVDYLGSVWIGTAVGVLQYGDGWSSYSGPEDNYINSITIDQSNGSIWFGTNGGASRFYEGVWDNYGTKEGLLCNHVNAIALDGQGNTWIGAGLPGNSSGVVSEFNGDMWVNYPLTNGLLCNYISCLSVDLDNNKWFGFGDNGFGVTEFDGTNWTNYSMNDGLVSNNVYCMLVDSKGNKWFGTSNGVSKFDGEWINFGTGSQIFDIAEDHQGRLWFATSYGVTVFDGENSISYSNQNGLPDGAILSIAIDANDNIWAGSQSGGAAKFNGTLPWTIYTADGVKLESNYVSTIKTDSFNNIWFGYGTAGFGVTKYDGTNWTHYHQNAGLAADYVTSVAPDVFDIKWFGTINGVSKLQGNNWTNYTTTHGLVGNLIRDIAVDNNGNKWFVTDSGISKLEDRSLTVSQSTIDVTCTNNSTASFDITSNITWTVSSNQPWLTLSNSSGSGLGSITATATFNPGEAPRTAIITATGTGVASKTVTITQAATLLTVSATTLDMAVSENSTASFSIASNIGWTISCDKTWLTLSSASGTNNGTITATGLVNASEDSRAATVTVTGNGISKTVTITQAASLLALSHTALDIAAAASSIASFSITSNIGWSVSSNQTWLTLSGLSGINNADITITASVNTDNVTRTATITVFGTGVTSKTITITQAAAVTTGFKEISDPGIILYPIPVIDKLNISVTEPVSKTSITLYNRGGIVIYTSTSTEGVKELDMSQYSSGIYYIKIVTSDNKISIQKIIKQ